MRRFSIARIELTLRSRLLNDPAASRKLSSPVRSSRASRRQLVAYRLAVKAIRPLIMRRSVSAEGRPRVTILLMDAYGMSGVVRTVLNVAGYLASHHEIEIVSVLRTRERPFFPFPSGVHLHFVDDQRKGRVGGVRRWVRAILRRFSSRVLHPADKRSARTSLWTDILLLRRLLRVRAGVVIGTRPSLNMLGSQLSRPGVAVVGWEQVNLAARGPSLQAEIRRNYGALDAMVVLTEADRCQYDEALAGATRVVRIPNAVPYVGGPRSDVSRPVVLAAGRLTRQKGFGRLIPAFARVAEQAPDWTLRICGRGPRREHLGRMIIKHGVSDHVMLVGQVTDMALQMEQASIFVLSSRWEGFPMVLLEAMTKGLPVVSFDCPTGPADIVEDGRTGFLVSDGDVDALGEAILELIRDEPKRRRFGAAAAERAKAFTLPRIGRLWEELLADLAPALDVSGRV